MGFIKFKMIRRKSKKIQIGNLTIGGDSPVIIQSMTNTQTSNIEATVQQINELEKYGCEMIRVGVPNIKSAQSLSKIKSQIHIPLIADIHFSAELAIEAINQGVDKIRINPGNFPKDQLGKIINLANEKDIPIRIGVNSGSLEKDLIEKYHQVTAEAMVESALRSIRLMESLGFYNLVIALKASDVLRTVKAYQLLSNQVDYPFHLGITEAGTKFSGTIKSAIGIGSLLLNGIGDTIRVSLSSNPIDEVKVAWEILKDLKLRKRGVEIVSCPTCARTKIDVIGIAKEIEKISSEIKKPIKVAVMGCVVNGLGESAEADLGIVGTEDYGLIIKNGKIDQRVKKENLLEVAKKEILDLSK